MLHSKLPPSSASRRMACPGSYKLESLVPNEETQASREGEAAHWVAMNILQNLPVAEIAPNGEIVTAEMFDGAYLYEKTIRDAVGDSALVIEQPIDISNVHPECWGTPDSWAIVDNVLHLFDYKFGFKYVNVIENWQLLEYAAGIAQSYQFAKINFYIIQPRNYYQDKVRQWTISLDKLIEYIAKLQKGEQEAFSPVALCKPSIECVDCKARHLCQAFQKTSYNIIHEEVYNLHKELDTHALSHEIKYLRYTKKLLDARLEALEQQAEIKILGGELIPGFRIDYNAGREKWNADIEEILTLAELLGIELRKPQELITPVQARKAGLPSELVEMYSQRQQGSRKLVQVDNAKHIFGSTENAN